jgi:hypothetical protein
MAIPDSGAPYCYTQLDCSSKNVLLAALKQALVDSGWSLRSSTTIGTVTLSTGNVIGNGNTATFDGIVYTFRTALTQGNPREVKCGASAAESMINLADAINANPATSGIGYSSSTTAHPTCTASNPLSAQCMVSGPNGFVASETTNGALDRTVAIGANYKLDSARCPSGLQMRLILDDDGVLGAGSVSTIRIRAATCDESTVLTAHWRLAISAGRLLEFVGCKHQVFIWLLGAFAEYGCNFHCGTPALRAHHAPARIASITDSGGLVQITTTLPHGLVTGEHAYISGATKDEGATPSAVNGDWQVTVIDSLNYTLDGSVYAAEAYDVDSGVSGSASRISRAFWAMGDEVAMKQHSFRTTTGMMLNSLNNVNYGVALNQFSYSYMNGFGSVGPRLKVPIDDGTGQPAPEFGGLLDLHEARISWPITAYVSQVETVGNLWLAFVVPKGVPMDKVKHNFLGFNWINYTHNATGSRGSLWIATSPAV